MRDSNTDLFDPRTAMDSDSSPGSTSTVSSCDFGFAFNDSNFSDRVLRIEIMAGPQDSRSEGEGCTSLADWARHRKRRREDMKKENGLCFFSLIFLFLCLVSLKADDGVRKINLGGHPFGLIILRKKLGPHLTFAVGNLW